MHASDVHIGDVSFDPVAPLDAEALEWWRRHRVLDGFLGHSHVALRHLRDRFIQLAEREDARLLFTGDLTAVGDEMQFLVGRTYLEGRLVFDQGALLGLEESEALARGIPGNHDRWPGHRGIIGAPTPALTAAFPVMPRIDRMPLDPIAEIDRRQLVLISIDSEADVSPWGLDRLTARGDFVTQLERLATVLAPSADHEVRVMLLHHTPLVRGRWLDRITRRSEAALWRFVEELDIRMLLTGHVHEPLADTRSFGSAHAWTVGIVCAGTATQRDEPPASWQLAAHEVERFRLNTIAVHRIREDDHGHIYWDVQFELRGELGFVPIPEPDLPPIRLWPR